jgi:hypothetical protein
MKQQGTINVHGGVSGNGNQFNNRNYHIKNINNGGGNGNGGKGDDITVVVAIFAAIVGAAYAYLAHYAEVFFWLKMGVVLAGAIHLAALIPLWRDLNAEYRDLWPLAVGFGLTFSQTWVIILTQEALPPIAIEIAAQPTVAKGFFPQALEVWRRFNATGHRLILENLSTAIALAPAIFLNILFGLQHLLQAFARSENSPVCKTLSDWLRVCRTRGSAASFAFVALAFLIISGLFSGHAG